MSTNLERQMSGQVSELPLATDINPVNDTHDEGSDESEHEAADKKKKKKGGSRRKSMRGSEKLKINKVVNKLLKLNDITAAKVVNELRLEDLDEGVLKNKLKLLENELSIYKEKSSKL